MDPRRVADYMLVAYQLVAAAATPNNVAFDTPRDVHLCEQYYIGDPSECEAMRAQVRALRRDACPTLELGDPSRPPMLFFHGWPSSIDSPSVRDHRTAVSQAFQALARPQLQVPFLGLTKSAM